MELFKKTIKFRILLLQIFLLLAIAFMLYDQFFMDQSNKEYMVSCLQIGLIFGFSTLAIIKLIQYNRVIRSEKLLKLEYNKEHDERKKIIRSKCGMPMLMITSSVMIVAGIIAGYYNEIILVTLIGAAMFQMTIGAVAKVYYLRKM